MEGGSPQGVMAGEMILRPVGVVRSALKEPSLRVGSGDLEPARTEGAGREEKARKVHELISEIVIDPRLEGILDGIEEFSHILVLYWPHKLPEEKRNVIKVHPMGRRDLPLVGVFATCSPARPNPVLVTAVRLLERRGNVLKVQGLEAIDGSPIIDLKPYNPHYHLAKDVRLSGWMARALREMEGGEEEAGPEQRGRPGG